MPYQLLHPTVLVHFKDHKGFRLFATAYLLDLLDQDTTAHERPERFFYVPILNQIGQTVNVRLGRLWEMSEVLRVFLAPGNEPVREVVEERYGQVYQEYKEAPNYPDNLKQLLLQKCEIIAFTTPPAGGQDPIDRDHLKLAMQAVLQQYVGQL